jgi:hypothetical protein
VAQAADVVAVQVEAVDDEFAAALVARRQRQHLAAEKAHQGPGPRQRQQRLLARRRRHLFEIELIGLHDRFDAGGAGVVDQEFVDVDEQRGMDIRLPGDEPVG